MDPEENYDGVLMYVDGHTTGTYTYTTPPVQKPVSIMRYNSDDGLVIPPAFEKVLKKTIDGLVSVRIIGYETVSIVNPMKWERENQYINFIELTFKFDSNDNLTKEEYSNQINFAFEMTYPDIKSYRFSVKTIVVENPGSHKEFLEFFSR